MHVVNGQQSYIGTFQEEEFGTFLVPRMKLPLVLLTAAANIAGVVAHATFQQMWVNGVDQGNYCARTPANNNPVSSVTSNDIACNAGASSAAGLCSVNPGDKVTVEMHQQPGQRSCSNESIGGAHYGPVIIYMAKVSDAKSAAGSSAAWFKVAEMGLASSNPIYWAVQVLNDNCGHYTFTVPNISPGQYLLRAEVIALHVANSVGGAQFYMTCYQLNVGGSGTGNPPTVKFPGAYKANDPGIHYTLWLSQTTYQIPGPTPYGTSPATPAKTPYPKTATWNKALQPSTVPSTPASTSIAGGA